MEEKDSNMPLLVALINQGTEEGRVSIDMYVSRAGRCASLVTGWVDGLKNSCVRVQEGWAGHVRLNISNLRKAKNDNKSLIVGDGITEKTAVKGILEL